MIKFFKLQKFWFPFDGLWEQSGIFGRRALLIWSEAFPSQGRASNLRTMLFQVGGQGTRPTFFEMAAAQQLPASLRAALTYSIGVTISLFQTMSSIPFTSLLEHWPAIAVPISLLCSILGELGLLFS